MNPSVRENMMGEITENIPLPIKFVFLEDRGFYVLLYHEHTLKGPGSDRDGNSDMPWANWEPIKGFSALSHFYTILNKSGLLPAIEKTCREAYDAWREA